MASTEYKDQTQFALAEANLQHESNHTVVHQQETHKAEEEFQFNQLFDELSNHYGFAFGPVHLDMPMIFYDKEQGFNFYSSPIAMENAGVYTMQHHKPVKTSNGESPTLDLSITSLLCFQWVAMIVLIIIFARVGGKYKKNPKKAPIGLQNMIEMLFVFVRDDMVLPNVGSKQLSNRLLPYFIALFFFILIVNLMGLIPGAHTATGSVGTCAGLALTALVVINVTAIKEIGIGAYLKHLLGGAPLWMAPIMVPIEILSMFIKPFALTIRLFANMTAGHVVIIIFIYLVMMFQSYWVGIGSVAGSLMIYLLELLVAFIQAYIFAVLSAMFIGTSMHAH